MYSRIGIYYVALHTKSSNHTELLSIFNLRNDMSYVYHTSPQKKSDVGTQHTLTICQVKATKTLERCSQDAKLKPISMLNGSGEPHGGCGSCHWNGSFLLNGSFLPKNASFLRKHGSSRLQRHQQRQRHLQRQRRLQRIRQALGVNNFRSVSKLLTEVPWHQHLRLLHLHSPADCGCSTRPVKANTEHKWQCCKFDIDAAHECTKVVSTTFPGLLWGRPTDVPILQSGMAVIWKLHVNAPSSMHSLPAPNTVHLGPLPQRSI